MWGSYSQDPNNQVVWSLFKTTVGLENHSLPIVLAFLQLSHSPGTQIVLGFLFLFVCFFFWRCCLKSRDSILPAELKKKSKIKKKYISHVGQAECARWKKEGRIPGPKQHYRRFIVTHIFVFAAVNISKNFFPNIFFPLCSFRAWKKKSSCTKECIGNNKYFCYLLAKKAAGAPFTSKEYGFNL